VREKYCWLVADKPNEQAEMEVKNIQPPLIKGIKNIHFTELLSQTLR
jgi:hypothetical protein